MGSTRERTSMKGRDFVAQKSPTAMETSGKKHKEHKLRYIQNYNFMLQFHDYLNLM